MSRPRCPGQDTQYWKPEDIFEVPCPHCATRIEFWKDEPVRVCPSCKREVRNPRLDPGCTKWCKHGEECSGTAGRPEEREDTEERIGKGE